MNWHCNGTALALDWLISKPANRLLASIEASDRLAYQEMKLYYRERVPWIQQIWLALHWNFIGTQLAQNCQCIDGALEDYKHFIYNELAL